MKMDQETQTLAARDGSPLGAAGFVRAQWRKATTSDFGKKVAETYLTQIFLILIGLITTIIITRSLGPTGRGLYATAMAIGAVGVQFGHFGTTASNTYHLGQDPKSLPNLFANSILLTLVVAAFVSIVTALFVTFRPNYLPVQGTLLWLGILYIPLGLNFLLMENLLIGTHRIRAYNQVEVLNRVLILLGFGSVILAHKVSPEVLLAANLAIFLLSNLIAIAMLHPGAQGRPSASLQLFLTTSRVGIRAYVVLLLGFMLLRVDLLMVKYMLGAREAGYYSVASSMADYVLMLPGVVGMVLFPKLAGMKDDLVRYVQCRRATVALGLALLPALLIAAVAARPIVRLLFGVAFEPSARAFLWLIPGIFFMGVETSAVQFLNAKGYPISVLVVWFVSVVGNIAGNLWAIPKFGIEGASLMSSISYTGTFVLIWFVIRRQVKGIPKNAG